ncbi:uncharacterized protein [Littorina saxatilis]|uniref:uncharacterized protein n=1 Tax=Littorina saxatilis TaxID=31220 RepID=UPI0038B5CD3C
MTRTTPESPRRPSSRVKDRRTTPRYRRVESGWMDYIDNTTMSLRRIVVRLELQTQVLALGTMVTWVVLENIGEADVLFRIVADNSLQVQVEASFVDNAPTGHCPCTPPGAGVLTCCVIDDPVADLILGNLPGVVSVSGGCGGSIVPEEVLKEPQISSQIKPFIVIEDRLLLRVFHEKTDVFQIVVPTSLRDQVLHTAQYALMTGHFGTRRTLKRILTQFFWPGVRRDVGKYCRTCDVCQKTSSKGRVPTAPLQQMPLVDVPFKKICIDLVGPFKPESSTGFRYVLTIVDTATRFPEAIPLKTIDTVLVSEALFSVFARMGCPQVVVSDCGTQFVSDLMKEIYRLQRFTGKQPVKLNLFCCCRLPLIDLQDSADDYSSGEDFVPSSDLSSSDFDEQEQPARKRKCLDSKHNAADTVGGIEEDSTPNDADCAVNTPNDGDCAVNTPNDGDCAVNTPNDGDLAVNTPNDGNCAVNTPNDGDKGGERRGKKPNRPCIYCGMYMSKLKRHLIKKHRNEEGVEAALALPFVEQNRAIEGLRKEGIYRKNVDLQAGGCENDKLIKKRAQGTAKTVMCGGCKGFYSHRQIHKHKKHCSHTFSSSARAVYFDGSKPAEVSEEFQKEVLERFRDDDCGKLCRKDHLILLMGQKLWMKSVKKERKVVMSEMRRMGNVILAVNRLSSAELSGEDVLTRKHFDQLTQAIQDLTQREEKGRQQKSGLKLAIGFTLKKAIKVLKGLYTQHDELEKAKEIGYFSDVLDLHWDYIFYTAQVECEQRRGVLRKPASMPIEQDVKNLKEFVLAEMQKLLQDDYKLWGTHDFVWMRNLIVCRLTMFNARRGGEPARMTLTEWEDAEQEKWIAPNTVQKVSDPLEASLLKKTKLAYMAGKGSKRLVPLLIPVDTVEPLRKLVKERGNANIHSENVFLFPNTGGSLDHAVGWNSLSTITTAMSDKLESPQLLIADKFRHRASTLFALLDVPDQERESFYRHMGHSADINKHVYQCPLAVTEITKVGGFLSSIDGSGKRLPAGKKSLPRPVVPCSSILGHQSPEDESSVEGLDISSSLEPCQQSLRDERSLPGPVMSCSVVPCRQPEDENSLSGSVMSSSKTMSGSVMSSSHSLSGSVVSSPNSLPRSVMSKSLDPGRQPPEDESSLSEQNRGGKSGRKYNVWNMRDEQEVSRFFSVYIKAHGVGSKGSLPGVVEVKKFLTEHPIFSNSTLPEKEKITLVKTKVFNERNKYRNKAKFDTF